MTPEQLKEWHYEPQEREVKIGKKTVKLQEVIDPTRREEAIEIARSREALSRSIPLVIEGETYRLNDNEAFSYSLLEFHIIDPPLTYADLVQVSRGTREDCIDAATVAMELMNLGSKEIEAAKNDSGEAEPQTRSQNGYGEPSPLPSTSDTLSNSSEAVTVDAK